MGKKEKQQAIDIDKIDLEKMREMSAENPGILPYAHSVGGAMVKPEEKGKLKGRAVSAMHQQTEQQMAQLYQQMKLLADQANTIKKRVEVSERIYNADMSFEPLINHIYYLYKRDAEKDVLSMIGPSEWGKKKRYAAFVAKIRLMADHTWEILESNDSVESDE